MNRAFLFVVMLGVWCAGSSAVVAQGEAVGWARESSLAVEEGVGDGSLDGLGAAQRFEALWHEARERFGDEADVLEARMELVSRCGSLMVSDWTVKRSADLVAVARGRVDDAELLRRALYVRGEVGLGMMSLGRRNREVLAGGRAIVRDAAGDPAAAGWAADWLHARWSFQEPAARLRRTLAQRAVDGALERGDQRVLMIGGFSAFLVAADGEERARYGEICLSSARRVADDHDAALLELFLTAGTGMGSGTVSEAELEPMVERVIAVVAGDGDIEAAQEDVAALQTLAAVVGATSVDLGMRLVGEARSIAEERLGGEAARREAALVACARLTKRLTGEVPAWYEGTDIDRYVASASFGMEAPRTPWVGEEPPTLTATLAVVVMEEGAGEGG